MGDLSALDDRARPGHLPGKEAEMRNLPAAATLPGGAEVYEGESD